MDCTVASKATVMSRITIYLCVKDNPYSAFNSIVNRVIHLFPRSCAHTPSHGF